jgi:hypothetical protein
MFFRFSFEHIIESSLFQKRDICPISKRIDGKDRLSKYKLCPARKQPLMTIKKLTLKISLIYEHFIAFSAQETRTLINEIRYLSRRYMQLRARLRLP